MEIRQSQAEVRLFYKGGSTGPLISGIIWLAASYTYQVGSSSTAMLVLFFGGMLIFPLSTLALKLSGGPSTLPKGHPAAALAMQSAFTVPPGLLVAVALGTLEPGLFFPTALIIVGAHYLTFITLYGMWLYGPIAGVLIIVGVAAIFWLPGIRDLSGWIGGVALLASSIPLHLDYRSSRRKDKALVSAALQSE